MCACMCILFYCCKYMVCDNSYIIDIHDINYNIKYAFPHSRYFVCTTMSTLIDYDVLLPV